MTKPRPAEEWLEFFGSELRKAEPHIGKPERKACVLDSEDIKTIQRDAFRAGMQKAAEIAKAVAREPVSNSRNIQGGYVIGCNAVENAILAAAEKEKL